MRAVRRLHNRVNQYTGHTIAGNFTGSPVTEVKIHELKGIVNLPVIPLRGIAVLLGRSCTATLGVKTSAMEQALSGRVRAVCRQKNAKTVDVGR